MKHGLLKVMSIFTVFLFIFNINNLSAEVDPSGNFNTNIPIKIPAGTNGMHPSLSLNYNSGRGNGMLGVGWNLSGIPAISRMSYDSRVNYDGNDTYTGPEGRLVDVSGNKSFYHPENETWTKYVPYGSQGDGPQYWIAYANGGKKYYYGYSDNSRILQLDPETGEYTNNIRTWPLTRIEDAHGNYYEVEYEHQRYFTNSDYVDFQADLELSAEMFLCNELKESLRSQYLS